MAQALILGFPELRLVIEVDRGGQLANSGRCLWVADAGDRSTMDRYEKGRDLPAFLTLPARRNLSRILDLQFTNRPRISGRPPVSCTQTGKLFLLIR